MHALFHLSDLLDLLDLRDPPDSLVLPVKPDLLGVLDLLDRTGLVDLSGTGILMMVVTDLAAAAEDKCGDKRSHHHQF